MRRRLRIDVAKGEHVLVLEYLGAGDLAAQNAGEDVGAVVGHRARPEVMGFALLYPSYGIMASVRRMGRAKRNPSLRPLRHLRPQLLAEQIDRHRPSLPIDMPEGPAVERRDPLHLRRDRVDRAL